MAREYRTYFHIGQSWGVNESYSQRNIRKTEDTLVSSRAFALAGKKKLQESDCQIEVVVVDVTETPSLASPKKHSSVLQWQKEKTHTQITTSGKSSHERNHLYGS